MIKIELINYESTTNIEKLICTKFPFIKYYQVKELLDKKSVYINDKRVTTSRLINFGDKYTIFLNEKDFKNELDPKVIYEDDNIYVIYKPIKIASEGDVSISEFIKKKNNNLILVHRLDTNTDGLLMFAKNIDVFNSMKEIFYNRQISKKYVAIATTKQKLSDNLPILFSDYLVKDTDSKQVYIKQEKCNNGVNVLTQINNYSLINKFQDKYIYYLELEIFTGKTHQIRAQLASHNIYILGDEKYGDYDINKIFHVRHQLLTFNEMQFNIKEDSFLAYLNKINIKLNENIKFQTNLKYFKV